MKEEKKHKRKTENKITNRDIVKDEMNGGQRRGVINRSILWNDVLYYFRE